MRWDAGVGHATLAAPRGLSPERGDGKLCVRVTKTLKTEHGRNPKKNTSSSHLKVEVTMYILLFGRFSLKFTNMGLCMPRG